MCNHVGPLKSNKSQTNVCLFLLRRTTIKTLKLKAIIPEDFSRLTVWHARCKSPLYSSLQVCKSSLDFRLTSCFFPFRSQYKPLAGLTFFCCLHKFSEGKWYLQYLNLNRLYAEHQHAPRLSGLVQVHARRCQMWWYAHEVWGTCEELRHDLFGITGEKLFNENNWFLWCSTLLSCQKMSHVCL